MYLGKVTRAFSRSIYFTSVGKSTGGGGKAHKRITYCGYLFTKSENKWVKAKKKYYLRLPFIEKLYYYIYLYFAFAEQVEYYSGS